MTLPTCCVCGASAFAINPGSEPPEGPTSTAGFLHPLRFGARPTAWCLEHWPWRRHTPDPQPQPEPTAP